MKKILFSFLIITLSAYGQPHRDFPIESPKVPFESEVISIPKINKEFSIYYIYKVPYKLLVFERENNTYHAQFRAIVEIKDKDDNLVVREIKDTKVQVPDFQSTSDPALFLQDYLNFKLDEGEYSIFPIISDLNSEGELRIKSEKVELIKNTEKLVFEPFIIEDGKRVCNDTEAFILANTGGELPFSSKIYHMAIPVKDTLINELTITIENNDDTILSNKVQESYVLQIGMIKCEDNLAVTMNDESIPVRFFVVREINKKVREGNLIVKIQNSQNDIDEEYKSRVEWLNKPFSLRDVEKAIEFLSYIEPDSVVYIMLDKEENEYLKILDDYWKKFDPTPETSYNEIMAEFYNRIDYAMREFMGLNKGNGAKTDRGIVYIKFGKPDEIKRTSNPLGQIIEIWTYQKPQRNFSFVDKKGTGNFTLIEE